MILTILVQGHQFVHVMLYFCIAGIINVCLEMNYKGCANMESREKIWKMNILQLTTNSMYLK